MPDNHIKERFSALFLKYHNGNCTRLEAEEILEMLENPDNDNFLEQEAAIFLNSCKDQNEYKDSMRRIQSDLHQKINLQGGNKIRSGLLDRKLFTILSRIAALLFIPLFLYSLYVTFLTAGNKIVSADNIIWQTIKVPAGVQTEFILSDGSHVWLNSGSIFKYPDSFVGGVRQVELSGEGYFDIFKDPENPFLVNAGKLNIEVKGTRFVVVSYPDDPDIEVILESGNVLVYDSDNKDSKPLSLTLPGDKITYNHSGNTISVQKDDIDKYTSWKEGIMIFRDDPMNEVARRLSHRFNVEIELKGVDIQDYVYTATFKNESLTQILDLLMISAPIRYTRTEQKFLNDNTFTKSKIIITKIK